MKVKLWVGIFLFIGIIACEKDNSEPESIIEKDANYFPLTTGSYWVYNTYSIDSSGNETLQSENDTLRIIGDSIINNNSFKVFYGKEFGITQTMRRRLYRDSANYIIDQNGERILNQQNLTDTLSSYYMDWDSTIYVYSTMEAFENELSYPSGSFNNIINKSIRIERHKNTKEIIRKNHDLFAPQVGRIMRQYFYISTYERQKSYFEERLVDYYIAE